MKKSQLRQLIRESIQELMTEQKRGGSETCSTNIDVDTSEERPIKEQAINYHTWEVCSITLQNNVGVSIPTSWTGAFSFAALGPTSGSALWGPTGTLNSFYNWVVSQVGPINVGDTITFDMGTGGMCEWLGHYDIDTICFKYLGLGPLNVGTCWNGTTATAISSKCCDVDISGCTDSLASNYNAAATIDDGSCTYDVYGCTNPQATNYNPLATIDNGSCLIRVIGDPVGPTDPIDPAVVYGCTDPLASNYNSAATQDDGSCEYPIDPCDDFNAVSVSFQQACCGKCVNGVYTGSPTDPCGMLGNFCDCCPEDEIQCSKCNNGYPISNMFSGPNCPPGWQLASLGNPCKPLPNPNDPLDMVDPQIQRMKTLMEYKKPK
jgi:hypothetical protein